MHQKCTQCNSCNSCDKHKCTLWCVLGWLWFLICNQVRCCVGYFGLDLSTKEVGQEYCIFPSSTILQWNWSNIYCKELILVFGRCSNLMLSMLDFGSSGQGLCLDHCVVFFGKTIHSGLQMSTGKMWQQSQKVGFPVHSVQMLDPENDILTIRPLPSTINKLCTEKSDTKDHQPGKFVFLQYGVLRLNSPQLPLLL